MNPWGTRNKISFKCGIIGCCFCFCWWCFWFPNNLNLRLSRVLKFSSHWSYESVGISLVYLLPFSLQRFLQLSHWFLSYHSLSHHWFKSPVEKVCYWLLMNLQDIFNLIYSKYVFFRTHDELLSVLNDASLKSR